MTFGFETQATSWLTLESFYPTESLFGSKDDDGNASSARTTTLGVGASLTWGNLRVDGVVSTRQLLQLEQNDLMSNVSAVYNF